MAAHYGGTWEKIEGRFILGASSIYSVGSTGGEATHTLTENEMPSHRHTVKDGGGNWNASCGSVSRYDIRGVGGITNNGGYSDTIGNSGMQILGNTGGGQAHNNMPPYRVAYIYKRLT